jgi:hypothetical protein
LAFRVYSIVGPDGTVLSTVATSAGMLPGYVGAFSAGLPVVQQRVRTGYEQHLFADDRTAAVAGPVPAPADRLSSPPCPEVVR